MTSKGKFIVFEGGEGSGKTRHSEFVADELRADGHEVVMTHEPGGTPLGKVIRKAILGSEQGSVLPRTELFLFLADRAQHVEELIQPALDEGKIVICDRFSGSTFAYQLGGRGLPDADFIKEMDSYVRAGISPDLVVYLDIDPRIGLQRKLDGREEMNSMDNEKLSFHDNVRQYFQMLASQDDSWVELSSEGPKEENAVKVLAAVRDRLSL